MIVVSAQLNMQLYLCQEGWLTPWPMEILFCFSVLRGVFDLHCNLT